VVLRPAAVVWRNVVPRPLRQGVRNALGNLRTPIILVNDLLQGETARAGRTASRFLINSTLGVGGLIDVANDQFGLPGHTEDYGQTLARWNAEEGPYLFIPVIGPSNPRDLFGFMLGIATDPFTWVGQGTTVDILTGVRAGATVVDTREDLLDTLDAVERSSLDPYATLRSGYRQRRRAEIENRLDRPSPGTSPAASPAAAPAALGTGFGIATTPEATPGPQR
jgi:phospholipid-binding lipoprotein MlaA